MVVFFFLPVCQLFTSFALLPTSEHCCANQDVFFFFFFFVLLQQSSVVTFAQIMMFGIADDCFESRSEETYNIPYLADG